MTAATSPNFGTDVSTVPDLWADMRVTSGTRLVSECVYNRYRTPRGSLKDDLNCGYDLSQLLDDDINTSDLGSITAKVQAEAVKDERVQSCAANVTLDASGDLTVTIACTTALGPFSLVLGVSSVTGVTLRQSQ